MASLYAGLLVPLFSTLLKDEAPLLQKPADDYLTSVVNNPAPDNVAAASLAFQAQVLTNLPNEQATAIKDTAAALKSYLDAQVPSLVASATSAATATIPAAKP